MLKNKKTTILLIVFALLFCLLAAGAVSAADPPTANFTSNVTNGTGPLSVQFNDTSTGNVNSWNWDFGDSSTSTEQNPTHTYTNEGNYSISLTAFNADGNSTITQNDYITVAIPPTVTNSLTGGTYNTTQTVTLTTDDPTATIYYANDTTDPRNSTTRTQYTTPIPINTTTTLRYAAQDIYGNWSPLYLQNYLIGNNNSSWPKFQENLNNTGQSPNVGPQTNTTLWTYTTEGYIYYAAPVISADGTIYIGSYDSKLYAINPDGTLKWTYTTGSRIYGSAAIGSDGTIYIGSYDSKLYAINPDGTLKWTYTTGNYIYGSPAIDSNGTIYVGSADNKIYAINPDGTLKWTYTTGSSIRGAPAIGSDRTIYIGSNDNKLYAINSDGTLKWTYTTGGYIYGAPAIGADGTIYIGSYDSKLYAINPNGTLKWTHTTGGRIYGTSTIGSDGTIYVGSYDKNIYAVKDLACDLNTSVTVDNQNPKIGDNLNITFKINNNGPGTSFRTILTYKLPEWLEYIGETSDSGTVSYNTTSKVLTWTMGDLGLTSTSMNILTHVIASGTYNITPNLAKITSDANETNNIGSVTVTVLGPVLNTRTNAVYNTIQSAIDDVNTLNGDTILVGSGNYSENINIKKQLTMNVLKAVTISAANVNIPVFTVSVDGSNSVINGFIVTGATNSSGIYILPSVNVSITNNTITDNKIGIYVDNGAASIHFNNIYGNELYGLKFTGNNVDATNNWWGTNNPTYVSSANAPGKTDIYEAQNQNHIIYSPWIVLTVNNSDNLLKERDKSIITVDMTQNSWGQDTSSQGNIPDTPIAFNYNLGTLTNTSTTTSRGRANATITAKNISGKEDLTTTVTGYTVNTTITVDAIAPTANNSVTGGTYNTTQIVTLTTDDTTATIYYTNDTTEPRNSTTRIQYTGPITISNTTTLRYAAVDPAGNWSPLYLQNYVIGNGGLANSPQPEFQNNNNHTGQSEYTGPQTANIQWIYTTNKGMYGYGSPTIGSDGTIYVGSGNVLYAINPDGTIKWNYTTSQSSTIMTSPSIGTDGTIYFACGKIIYALNSNGTLKWNYTTENSIYSSATIGMDGTIYIGSTDKNLYAINPDGTLKWTYTTENGAYYSGLEYSSPAIGTDGTIYIGSENGKLYAINPDGTLKWSYTATTGYIRSSPTIGTDGTIYFIEGGYGALIALNPDGTMKWTYNETMDSRSSSSWSTPAIGADETIYFAKGYSAYALNPDGTLKWTYYTENCMYYTSATIGADGTIYFGGNTVYAFNPDGTLKWTCGGETNSVAIGSDGTLYFGSSDKNIYAISNQVANFTANITSGSDPLTVQFTDTSTGNVTSWSWDFNNDGIVDSTEQNPTYTFSTALGTSTVYSVKLTVNTTSGTNSQLRLKYITVYALTAVNFTSDVTSGLPPLTVQFTDKSTGYNMASWLWDFGEGSTSNLQNPAHTYTAPGNYTVTLTVTNPAGSNSIVMSNYITIPVPAVPVASFTVNDTWGVNSTTVHFTDTSIGNNITSWFWNFGDGNNSTLQNPTHTYNVVGNYTVSLTVTNSEGNDTDVKNDYIIVRDGEADLLTSNRHIFINVANDDGVLYDVDGTTYGGPSNTYYIKCDGGGMNALHITNDPNAPGGQITNSNNLSGVLWVTNTGGNGYSDDIILLISVQGPLSDDFSVTITSSGYVFTPGVTSTATYVIGGINETFTKEDFFYGPQIYKPGSGTLGVWSLKLYNSQNTSDNSTASYLMFIDLKVGTLQGGIDGGAAKVEFNFGNMTTLAAFNAYSWCLSSNQGQGISWTNNPTSSGYTVTYVPVPVANFTANTTSGLEPLTVEFTDQSTGNVTSWSWDFNGDGVVDSTEQNPTWTYSISGIYNVVLMVTGPGGNITLTQNSYITVFNSTPPTVNASPEEGLFNSSQNVTLSSDQPGSIIYYTTDGTEPTSTSTQYTDPIQIYNTTTLNYVAVNLGGVWSQNYTKTYTIDTTAPTVTANPFGGNYNTAQTVTLTADDESATTIYYTTDGSDPTTSSTQYTGPINIGTTTTLKFMAVDAAGNQGTTQTETYNIGSDVYVQITPSKTNPTVGDKVTYTFKLGNNGPGDAHNIVFTYVIPEGVEYAGANVDQGTVTYDPTTRTLTWTVGDIAAGVDPYLWLNLNILQPGTFNILPTITLDSYNPGLINNIETLQVNTGTTGSGTTNTVNAATTTSVSAGTVPMQTTGTPLAELILSILCIGSGITLSRKK